MGRQQGTNAEGSIGLRPPKIEHDTVNEQHSGVDEVDSPVIHNDGGAMRGFYNRAERARRWRRIAAAALLRAEERGLRGGAELEDWLAAEREIDSETRRTG